MDSSALILLDPNELRTAAFAAFLEPWARQAGTGLHVVHALEGLASLPGQGAPAACLYSIGGLSLHDEEVGQTIERLHALFPDSPLVVFSDVPDSQEIAMAVYLGLRGFIPTTMPSHVALAAIQFILNGGTYHPHSAAAARPAAQPASAMIRHIDDHRTPRATASGAAPAASSRPSPIQRPGGDPALDPLTKRRHIEVLEFLAQGETNKEIARHLNLTEATIKVYVRELMRHFGAKNRMQVALKASAAYEAEAAPATLRDLPPPPMAGVFSGAGAR
ncbi:helix-turn-helix transcriptional regulator [Paracoccus shandongensis]|uniref:helix-turn-helix transcriptional regulator n=1 Tax=Paracoccus shandongensis TaxID=2816048 RepID=UPI001A8C813F|nr:response regulator transcription factor [Paracoccus shandongensis]